MIEVNLFLSDDLWRLVPRSHLAGGDVAGPHLATRRLREPASVKDVLEALGIPHCEVGAIREGRPGAVGRDMDQQDVVTGDLNLTVSAAVPESLDDVRFLCDQHLGKLARLLRMCGFDTAWERHWLEPEVARRALNDRRVVLSGSRQLLKRKALDRALLIRSDDPDVQLGEVLTRFQIADRVEFFGRCSLCNGRLREVAKADVESRIPPRTRKWLDLYYVCRGCDQLYWEGTHVLAVRRRVTAVLGTEPFIEPE